MMAIRDNPPGTAAEWAWTVTNKLWMGVEDIPTQIKAHRGEAYKDNIEDAKDEGRELRNVLAVEWTNNPRSRDRIWPVWQAWYGHIRGAAMDLHEDTWKNRRLKSQVLRELQHAMDLARYHRDSGAVPGEVAGGKPAAASWWAKRSPGTKWLIGGGTTAVLVVGAVLLAAPALPFLAATGAAAAKGTKEAAKTGGKTAKRPSTTKTARRPSQAA